jgi:hypothetical protein
MQFDSGNPADSIDLKNFTNKEKKESSEVELSRDTSKTEVVIMENKKAMPEKPIDATKRGTTRTKRTRQ